MQIDQQTNEELRQRFNPEGSSLRKHQLCALEILEATHELCQKHNINYYLSSGTLLGAVRHGGFIPWDDDVDIEMKWFDFIRFTRIAKKELPEKLSIQTHGTDKNYFAPYAKIRNNNTFIAEHHGYDRFYKYKGIYIDVFYTEKSLRFFTLLGRKFTKFILKFSKKEPHHIIQGICNIMYYIFYYLICPIFRIINLIFWPFCYSHLGIGHAFLKRRDNSDIFPVNKILFEGKEFNCPKDTDKYLRKLYGDYMKLPDLNNLHIHSVKTIIPDNY